MRNKILIKGWKARVIIWTLFVISIPVTFFYGLILLGYPESGIKGFFEDQRRDFITDEFIRIYPPYANNSYVDFRDPPLVDGKYCWAKGKCVEVTRKPFMKYGREKDEVSAIAYTVEWVAAKYRLYILDERDKLCSPDMPLCHVNMIFRYNPKPGDTFCFEEGNCRKISNKPMFKTSPSKKTFLEKMIAWLK